MTDDTGMPSADEIFGPLSAPIDPEGVAILRGVNCAKRPPAATSNKLEVEPAAAFPSSWRLPDDVEIQTLPDPEYLIDGILARRGVGVLYGPSGGAKTTIVAEICVDVATQRDFYGHKVNHRGSSVYVATEDVCGFKVRLTSNKRAAHLPLDRPIGVHTFPEPIDLRDAVSVAAFTRFLEESLPRPLELIVIDTYSASMPGATENSSEDTLTAMAHAHLWCERPRPRCSSSTTRTLETRASAGIVRCAAQQIS